jgi:di- and tripeptidase
VEVKASNANLGFSFTGTLHTIHYSFDQVLTLPISHYDVISARGPAWESDPFTLSARNGYLYGRGVTDNKGPIMAIACAAADLLRRKALELDLVMLLEGEEEAGSGGFMETVKRKKVCEICRFNL